MFQIKIEELNKIRYYCLIDAVYLFIERYMGPYTEPGQKTHK